MVTLQLDLNLILVISVVLLTFFTFCLLLVLIPLAIQLKTTITSIQTLLDSLGGVSQNIGFAKSVIEKSRMTFGSQIKRTGILVVSGIYGVLSGIKNYLGSCGEKEKETSYNGRRSKGNEEIRR